MNIRILSFLCCVLLSSSIAAQRRTDGVGLLGFSLEKKWSRTFSTSLMHQTMIHQNYSQWWMSFLDAGVGIRLNQHWSTELHARRIAFSLPNGSYQNRHLFYHTISYLESFRNWTFSFRHRGQQLIYENHFDDSFKGPFWYFREKGNVRYRFNYYWSAYVNGELFFPLNRPTRPTIDQVRYGLGLIRTFNQNIRLEAYTQLQQPTQVSRTQRWVTGVTLQYNW